MNSPPDTSAVYEDMHAFDVFPASTEQRSANNLLNSHEKIKRYLTITLIVTGILLFLSGLIVFGMHQGWFGASSTFLKHSTKLTVATPMIIGGGITVAGGITALVCYLQKQNSYKKKTLSLFFLEKGNIDCAQTGTRVDHVDFNKTVEGEPTVYDSEYGFDT
ncbi:MAG: hypothetical protein R3E91_01335 [Chlamydiales bacterium]